MTLLIFVALFQFCTTSKKATRFNTSQADKPDHRTYKLSEISTDKTYGYTERNPFKVGGVTHNERPLNEQRYLNALPGPNGEPISYTREGSCCSFKTPNGLFGGGLPDVYQLTYEASKEPIKLYINMYNFGELKTPKGLTFKISGEETGPNP